MIHHGNGKSHSAAVSLNRLEPAVPTRQIAAPQPLRHQVEDWVAEHPVASVAAAIAIGALVGWIIKRR